MNDKIVVFQDTKIRKVWHEDEWYFSVIDIVKALTESPTPRQYWGKIKDRAFKSLELSPIWVRLKLPAENKTKSDHNRKLSGRNRKEKATF